MSENARDDEYHKNYFGPAMTKVLLGYMVDENGTIVKYSEKECNDIFFKHPAIKPESYVTDLTEKFKSLYTINHNYNNKLIKMSDIISDNDIGKVIYIEYIRLTGKSAGHIDYQMLYVTNTFVNSSKDCAVPFPEEDIPLAKKICSYLTI